MSHHHHHPTAFRGSEWAYIVKMMPVVPLSAGKVSQVIPGGQQKGEYGVVQHVQGEYYQRKVLRV